ncbi:hypothetical protein [Phenylobacterium sp.]|jgi:hypothetical protein|uniref:hypothetical protein n=1 Tax=Phenylobacterium sp. TaxID=1871053 RepID=UPI002F416772
MARERPPDIDAEFRVVRGPWPRWMLHLSLMKLALQTIAVVVLLCLVGLALFLIVQLLNANP